MTDHEKITALRDALIEITEMAERCDSWESFPGVPIEKAHAALDLTAAASEPSCQPIAWALLSIMEPELTVDPSLLGYWTRKGRKVTPLYATSPSIDRAANARDAERLRFAMQDIDGFGGVVADKYDFAMQIAYDRGHDEPTKADELDGIRELIDAAMQPKAEKKGNV